MKSRMEKYYDSNETPKRTEKNYDIYDNIYSNKEEPASNMTVLDNANEIDINKIKDMIYNREDYKKISKYQDLLNKEQKSTREEIHSSKEEEIRNYDINEIIENKKQNKDSDYPERIRKISNTQYDILKGLNVSKEIHDGEEVDLEHLTEDQHLQTLIKNVTHDKELNTMQKTALDLFDNLKEDEKTKSFVNEKDTDDSSFYSSKLAFKKEDFEDFEDLKDDNKGTLLFKIIIAVLVLLIIAVLAFIIIGFMDIQAL